MTVAKFELASTRYRSNLKTVGNLIVKNSLQDFYAKEMYIHPKNRSVSFQSLHHFRVFTLFRHILKTAKNVTDRPSVHTKRYIFLPADFENGIF